MFESLVGKLDVRRGVKRLLTKGCQFNQNIGNKISCFYSNSRSLRNKFEELRAYDSQEKPNRIFITETWVKTSIHNNKFSHRDSLMNIILKDIFCFNMIEKEQREWEFLFMYM